MSEGIYSVAELTEELSLLLNSTYRSITVEGEISGFRPSRSPHRYFNLIEKESLIRVVLFSNRIRSLTFEPQDGQKVQITGSISVYKKSGNYQIIAEHLTLSGRGEQLRILEERRLRLLEEGLFSADRKKPIPMLPRKVLVITSPTGAVVHDIVQTLARRNTLLNIRILPCAVQGAGSGEAIAAQIRTANRLQLGDVIIIARGGGSIEDLLSFSDEIVVRAIADSSIPIISGVGHEVDYSLADFAADLRAPTPTAAAELVAASADSVWERIEQSDKIMRTMIEAHLNRKRLVLNSNSEERLRERLRERINPLRLGVDTSLYEMREFFSQELREKKQRVALLQERLNSLSPQKLLERGFAKVSSRTRGVITSVDDVEPKEEVILSLIDGSIRAEVIEKSSTSS